VQALTTQISLARMVPVQLVVLIEKQAGECMTSSLSEERNWSREGTCTVCTCGEKVKAFYRGHDELCASLFLLEVSRTLA